MLSIGCHAQSSYFAADFIPFRMIDPVDSLLTQQLDSLNEGALEGLTLELVPSFCKLNIEVYYLWLTYIPDIMTDTVNYLPYLARNTHIFYVSHNRKYKIPLIIGGTDDLFKYDEEKYPMLSTDTPRQFFSIIVVKNTHKIDVVRCEIPKWALKSEFRGE